MDKAGHDHQQTVAPELTPEVAHSGHVCISPRFTTTKAALKAAKARGVKLGGLRNLTVGEDVRELGQKAIQKRADDRAADYAPAIRELQADMRQLRRDLSRIDESMTELHAATVHAIRQLAEHVKRISGRNIS